MRSIEEAEYSCDYDAYKAGESAKGLATHMKTIPDHWDYAETTCLNHAMQAKDYETVILPGIVPLGLLVLITLTYKFYVSGLWNHKYGTWGHVAAMVNVRNYVGYRLLLMLVLALAIVAVAFTYSIRSDWSNPDFVIIFVVSSVNILNSYSSLRSHIDATLEVGDVADTIKIGSFKMYSKVETVMEAMEDGIMVMLTSGHDIMLTHELKISSEDCAKLKDCVMKGGVVGRHSMLALILSKGKSFTPHKISKAKSEKQFREREGKQYSTPNKLKPRRPSV